MNKKILTLDDYQHEARRTAIYPDKGANLIYTVVGLCGETGEFANKVKKRMRSYGFVPGQTIVEEDILVALRDELGGILWYVAACASELGVSLNQIGIDNIEELSGRVKKGNVEGIGDDRGKD